LLHTSSVCKEKEVVDLVKSIEDPAAKWLSSKENTMNRKDDNACNLIVSIAAFRPPIVYEHICD
jgi:CRISPR/Cas system type I-B associated protein Csh2 (Cas7 group RAMP superfamily)